MTPDSITERLAGRANAKAVDWAAAGAMSSGLATIGAMLLPYYATAFAREKKEKPMPVVYDTYHRQSHVTWGTRTLTLEDWEKEPDIWLRGLDATTLLVRLNPTSEWIEDNAGNRSEKVSPGWTVDRTFLTPVPANHLVARHAQISDFFSLRQGQGPRTRVAKTMREALRRRLLGTFHAPTPIDFVPLDVAKKLLIQNEGLRADLERVEGRRAYFEQAYGQQLAFSQKSNRETQEANDTCAALAKKLREEREKNEHLGELRALWDWYKSQGGPAPWDLDPVMPSMVPLRRLAGVLDRMFGGTP